MGFRDWLEKALDPAPDNLGEWGQETYKKVVLTSEHDLWEDFKGFGVYRGEDGSGWESVEAAMEFAESDSPEAISLRARVGCWRGADKFVAVNLDKDKRWAAARDTTQEGRWGLAVRDDFDYAWRIRDDECRRNARWFPKNDSYRIELEVWLAANEPGGLERLAEETFGRDLARRSSH
jgi:hypothetical protein